MESEKRTEIIIESDNAKTKEKKSKKRIIIVLIVAVLIVAIFLILNNRKFEQNDNNLVNNIESNSNQQTSLKYSTKTDKQASVTIEVTPKRVGIDEKENTFELSFNTHSVDLNFDFQKIIKMTDNLGNQYEAKSWTGGSGGHHLSGEIIFPEINREAKTIEIEIDGIGEVKRIFQWDLLR